MQNSMNTHDNICLPVIEWNNIRVVTTETLATGYGTNATNIRTNLSSNKLRFIEGVHYFIVEGQDLLNLRVSNADAQISTKVRNLTLYTEKGAARMSKIVDTDEAWEFFEKLENVYFSSCKPPSMSELEMIARIASHAAQQERRITQVEEKLDDIKQGTLPPGYQGYSYLQATYGLSNAKSKQLVMGWSVPHKKIPHVTPAGQVAQMSVVQEDNFAAALTAMMSESEQRGSQWYHPKMGRFSIHGWKPVISRNLLPVPPKNISNLIAKHKKVDFNAKCTEY